MKRNYRTMVLNSDYMPLGIKTWNTAFTLILKGKAVQVDFYPDDFIRDGHGRHYSIPAVIALKKYIRRDYKKAPFSKTNVFCRDHYQCQYCLSKLKSKDLTMDHVIPRSKWNKKESPTCWTNIVTACLSCNSKKADKSCKEADMFPANVPVQPGYDEIFFGLHFNGRVEKEWVQWLQVFPSFKNSHEISKYNF